MGFWAWFWIWIALAIGALAVFAFIGRSLFNRAVAVFYQISKVSVKAQELVALIESHEKAPKKGPSELISPEQAAGKRLSFLKAKAKKREERQRILIRSLKKYDSTESRFH
jgi:hypothetical protein